MGWILASVTISVHAAVYSFAVIGDAGDWTDEARDTRKSILAAGIRNLVLPGDNVYENLGRTYEEVWSKWKGFRFDVVAIGNHNLGYREEIEFSKMPGPYYEKNFGDLRFLVLNSDDEDSAAEQAHWLQSRFSEPKFTFVVFHHPPVTLSERHEWTEKKKFHHAILPLLLANRAQIAGVLVGHDHFASFVTLNDSPIAVSGGAARPEQGKATNYRDPRGYFVQTRWVSKKAPHWVRLDVDDSSREYWLNYIRSDMNKVLCSTFVRGHLIYQRRNCLPPERVKKLPFAQHSS